MVHYPAISVDRGYREYMHKIACSCENTVIYDIIIITLYIITPNYCYI